MLALYVILVVFVVVAVFFAAGRLEAETDERDRITAIEIADVNFSSLPDGVYYGECGFETVTARVRATVEGGGVTSIELLEHKSERGSSAEVIPAVIVAQQNLEVDAVTGATLSSKVILKATERALNSARRSCPYEAAS